MVVFAILITPTLGLSQANDRTDSDILQNAGRCSVHTMYENYNIYLSTIVCDGGMLEAIFPDLEYLDSENIVSRDASADAAAEFLIEQGFVQLSCVESQFGLALTCVYKKPRFSPIINNNDILLFKLEHCNLNCMMRKVNRLP